MARQYSVILIIQSHGCGKTLTSTIHQGGDVSNRGGGAASLIGQVIDYVFQLCMCLVILCADAVCYYEIVSTYLITLLYD